MAIFSALGTIFNDIICYPLGGIMRLFFPLTNNYALLLIIFTLIIRLVLFPLAVKQQRSSAEMLRMKPKMDKIQKKYAKDKERQQVEMSKLYQEEGYNPLSGCLPMLVQMPILFGLYQVVYNPLKYIMWFSQDKINTVASILRPYIKSEFNVTNFNDQKLQIYLAKSMENHMDKLGFLGHIKNIDFNLFGLDMTAVPKVAFTILIIIPILVYASQALSTWLSVQMNKQVQQGQAGGGMNSTMMVFLMPLMSVWISFSFPVAVGFYWIVSNVIMIVQTIILRKYFSLDKLAAQSEIKAEKRKQAIIDGTAKPSRMAEYAKKVMNAQKQQNPGLTQASPQKELPSQDEMSEVPETLVKVNAKGNKSRSQLKEEQRRRLANSRDKNVK